MLVRTDQLVEGCILAQEVKALSAKPIMTKRTVLTNQHIEILESFLVEKVEVEAFLSNGQPFNPHLLSMLESKPPREDSFLQMYLKATYSYRKMYESWESGAPIDYASVRKTIIPLIEKSLQHDDEVFTLYHYSNEEEYIFHHSVAVALIASAIAQGLGHNKKDVIQVGIAGFLMDCGMSRIDQRIIRNVAVLKKEEFIQIKEHPIFSYQMVSKQPVIQDEIKLAVLQHHERYDKSGYPFGLAEDKLHPYTKILAVADVFHAMTSSRKYRSKQSPFKVVEQLKQETFGKYDLTIVQALILNVCNFSIGNKVRLSNKKNAEIVFIDSTNPSRPMVRELESEKFIALNQEIDIYIEELIKS
ncbi:Cyclic di-GMP phosphodiesterase response regulator RpfG [Bacillus sp. THAF10]|uniref:HD-GYP domain-containing protein n=1 Tax=Bacillus sp. THAF10 TaxID=2587848 RepID=UPI001268A2FB|nr:HD-GYP domain-containing protein [Bacillus sp. THAF10]QFT87080.1 Cyclic di-GMP phosphodiesterase response regulator RpfG [Bacillus sp. THAF10]